MSTMATPTDPLSSAYVFFDANMLHDLVGHAVVATGLRHKPGVSTTATLTGPDDRPWGWAQVMVADPRDKIENARRRAAARWGTIGVRALPRGAGWFLSGQVGTDPRLHRARDVVVPVIPAVDAAIRSGVVRPLRYNALRRLVLRGSELAAPFGPHRVLRLTASEQAVDRATVRAIVARGVPLVTPLREAALPTSRRVTLWPWIEGGDLAATPDPVTARSAGVALADLHEAARGSAGEEISARVPPGPAPDLPLLRGIAAVGDLAPALAGRLRDVLQHLPERPWRPDSIIHGDFSADQVVGTGVDLRIVDLDRLQRGEAHQDLGGFAASELRRTGSWGLTAALLEGYHGTVVPEALTAWTVQALLLRLVEPFRAASPAWLEDIDVRLDQVERVLSEGVLP